MNMVSRCGQATTDDRGVGVGGVSGCGSAKSAAFAPTFPPFTRLHPNIMMTKAKVSGNYVGSILAKTESQRLGFDEAIMLDPQGYVAECTGENIFVVRNKIIYTVPRGSILEGITRDSVIDAGTRPWV